MTSPSTFPTRRAIQDAQRVCLFGVGVLLEECYDQIVLALGREPNVLCDNAPEKWNRAYFGRPCISPAELVAQGEGTVVVITARQHEKIRAQLLALGLRDILVARFDSSRYALRGLHALEASPEPEPSPIDLRGKWTLVTGASRGIGRQIALAMARLGSNLIVHSRSLAHLTEVQKACSGVQVVPVAAELAVQKEVEALLARLETSAPQVDIVFNNAAIATPWPEDIWSLAPEIYLECFAVNVVAPVLICQKLVPSMVQRGFGRIVNLHTNLQYDPHEMPYVCSKAALDKFIHDMAPSLEGTGVSMTLADPGWVRTDAGSPRAPNAVETVIPGVLLGAVLGAEFNGCRFNAQDYAELTLEAAIQRARQHHSQQATTWI